LTIGAYNLFQNLALPARLYVPANLTVAVGLVQLARRNGCTWEDLGLARSQTGAGVRLGAVGAAAAAAIAVVASRHPRTRQYFLDQRAAAQSPGQIAYRTWIRLPFGTALFEEVAFRGVIYGMWRRAGASHGKAAGVTAAAFGIWHLIPARDALTGNPLASRLSSRRARVGVVATGAAITTLSSFGFTWLRVKSGSLLAPWLTHAAINAAGYVAGVAAWRQLARS
jgi:membrane protease YdiL (CAAX protease family)